MIGQLINEFDELFDPTLADFNKTFKMSLKGDLSSPIKIGTMVVGGLREVFIDGKIELIELPNIVEKPKPKPKKKVVVKLPKQKKYVATRWEESWEFDTLKSLANFLGMSRSALDDRIRLGKADDTKGFKVVKNTPMSSYIYYAVRDIEVNQFTTMSDLAEFLNVSKCTIKKKFAKESQIEYKGYKLSREER